jgi:hypothetical protein
MSFIENFDVIVNKKDIFYRRLGVKKMFFQKVDSSSLDEGMLLNFPYTNFYVSHKSDTNEIPDSTRFKRAGFIPFTDINGKRYFCLGIDAKYGTLTDFGGGVKRHEHFIEAACRELKEESLDIFDFTSDESMEQIKKYTKTVYDENMAIIFVNIKVDNLEDIINLYQKRVTLADNPENSNIVWVPDDVFFFLIKSGKMVRTGKNVYPSVYKVVNDLLRSVSNINYIV